MKVENMETAKVITKNKSPTGMKRIYSGVVLSKNEVYVCLQTKESKVILPWTQIEEIIE